MAKVGRFIHEAIDGNDVAIDNAFGLGKQHDIVATDRSFVGYLEGIIVRVKTLAGNPAPTKITVKITHNSNGTGVVIPDTEATIAYEVGSTTEGGIAIKFAFAHFHTDGNFSIFYKTDAGTATIDAMELYWSE